MPRHRRRPTLTQKRFWGAIAALEGAYTLDFEGVHWGLTRKDSDKTAKDKTWVVEMTIKGRVRPVKVTAPDENAAMDAAEAKHQNAERTWNAYTMGEWRKIVKEQKDWERAPGTLL